MLGRCELAKLGEGAPVAAYERQLLGTKGRLPYWWPSPIPLCEVAPRGGWREQGRVCQGYNAFLGWPMPSEFVGLLISRTSERATSEREV